MTDTARKSRTAGTTHDEIIRLAAPLFARQGFEGISMRDIAKKVGVTPAALYHHFQDKESLYRAVITATFREKTAAAQAILASDRAPMERLEKFIASFTRLLSTDKDFQRLLHWTLLESTEDRMQAMAEDAFLELVCSVERLVAEMQLNLDPLLVTVSIMGMILFPFEAATASSMIPGHKAEHKKPEVLAQHILNMLLHGIQP